EETPHDAEHSAHHASYRQVPEAAPACRAVPLRIELPLDGRVLLVKQPRPPIRQGVLHIVLVLHIIHMPRHRCAPSLAHHNSALDTTVMPLVSDVVPGP